MRIDLATPFAEKDAAKALGARWDSARKTWYVQDMDDLTPFQRWIPAPTGAPASGEAPVSRRLPARAAAVPAASSNSNGTITQSVTVLTHCGCDVLPWEPCDHHR